MSTEKWKKEHTTLIAVRFNNDNDIDLLTVLNKTDQKSTELKRLARIGLEQEKKTKTE